MLLSVDKKFNMLVYHLFTNLWSSGYLLVTAVRDIVKWEGNSYQLKYD